MDDQELDRLLSAAGERRAVPLALLDRMVEGLPARRGSRRQPLVIGGAIAAGLLLAASATSDGWMRQEPFVSLPADLYRVQEPITVRWTLDDGEQDTCFAFLEYADLSVAQSERADAWVTASSARWAGLGQRLVDESETTAGPYERAEQAVFDGLEPVLDAAATDALPDVAPRSAQVVVGRAHVNGWTVHCERNRP